jgi:GNAT superfamily N-acetyltransferase
MSYRLSFAAADQQLDLIPAFLSGTYWSVGIPRHVVERAIAHSICVGMFAPDEEGGEEQVAFARVISDRATFAYLADVFVLPEHQGAGLGKWMMQCVMAHPDLQGLRRMMLVTSDAHGLYARHGFAASRHPERIMEKIAKA